MCTAVSFCPSGRYFGRNLDLEYFGGEAVTIVPRRAPLPFRCAGHLARHAAMIGVARVVSGRALFYDAMNEHGLAMAALSFPGLAHYLPETGRGKDIASFELIDWVLARCATMVEARQALQGVRVTDAAFSDALPPSPLHWMVSDGRESLVIEATREGVQVMENPVGVLTNAPEFSFHLWRLRDHMGLSAAPPENRFCGEYDLMPYSRGMGAIGLPGDLSSASRFVRAAFVRANSLCEGGGQSEVNQFFHILRSVEQPRGCARLPDGSYEFTQYSSCCDLERLVYHYCTYEDLTVRSVSLRQADPEGEKLQVFAW